MALKQRGDYLPRHTSQTAIDDLLQVEIQAHPLHTIQDIRQASEVDQRVFGGGNGEAPQTLFIASRAGYLLGAKDGDVVVAEKALLYDWNRNLYSLTTGVRPSHQTEGLGTLMAKSWADLAKKHGSGWIYALVSQLNGPQLNSYLNKRGLRAVYFFKDYYAGVDDYHLGDHCFLVAGDTKGDNVRPRTPNIVVACTDIGGIAKAIDEGNAAYGLRRQMGGTNLLLFQNGEEQYYPPIKRVSAEPVEGVQPIESHEGVMQALSMEKKSVILPSTIFFLKHIQLMNSLFGTYSPDGRLNGFIGLVPDKSGGVCIHGPFTDGTDTTSAQRLLQYAKNAAVAAGSNKMWTVQQEGSAQLEHSNEGGFEKAEVAKGLFDGTDGIVLTKLI
jgi:hypothetical protein